MADLPPTAPPADAPPAEAPPAEAASDTVDMSQVAGARAVAVQPDPPKKKKKKGEMAAVGPSTGALSPADQALADLGTKRGIETLFRSSYRVNMDLSALADAKANIMISINGLIVSILIASIAPGIEKNPWLLLPTSLFLIGCLVSLIFAVLAARPRVQSTVITPEIALRDRKNLLFFGNFSHMDESEFVGALKEVVMDSTLTYEMMMKDIYGVGSVLQKKYRLLRTSYGAFLVALVVGVTSFIGVFTYATLFDLPGTAPTIQAPPAGAAPGLLP